MNKIVCFIISVILCMGLCACSNSNSNSKDKSEKTEHSVDVAKLATEGQIPEAEFILGDPVDGVKDIIFELSAGMSHDEFCKNMRESGHEPDGTEYNGYVTTTASDSHTILSSLYNESNSVYCMYTTKNENAGIAGIAVVGNAYGFDGNTLIDYVKSSIDAEYTEAPAASDLYFLPKGDDGATCLTYELGAHKLEIYFSQYNTFVAAALYDTNIW